MNKLNKKGFTLIEMLVVIAIIAVLVSIIIPVVGNSTKKANAATDAANLRSMQATLTIQILNSEIDGDGGAVSNAPASKSGDGAMQYTYSEDAGVTVYFGTADKNIAYYADIAAGGDGSASYTGTCSADGCETKIKVTDDVCSAHKHTCDVATCGATYTTPTCPNVGDTTKHPAP